MLEFYMSYIHIYRKNSEFYKYDTYIKQILNFINMTYIGKNIKLNGTDNSKSLEDTYNKNVLDKSYTVWWDAISIIP